MGPWGSSEALDSELGVSDDSLASPLLDARGDGVASVVVGALKDSSPSSGLNCVNEFAISADTNDIVGDKAFM